MDGLTCVIRDAHGRSISQTTMRQVGHRHIARVWIPDDGETATFHDINGEVGKMPLAPHDRQQAKRFVLHTPPITIEMTAGLLHPAAEDAP